MNRKQHFRYPRMKAAQAGFTLIELMVAITISLVVMIALVTALVNITRNNSEMTKINSEIENGRFAIQLLGTELAQAGFWGSYSPEFEDLTLTTVPSDAPTTSAAAPDPCLAYTSWSAAFKNSLIAVPIQSYEDAPTTCTVIAHKKAGTDILAVRHADSCVPGDSNCDPDTTGRAYFQSSLCTTDATPYVLATSGFALHNKDCTTLASKRKLVSSIYYIRDYANTVGDGIPTLVRSQLDLSGSTLAYQAAVALIENIESFKVELGIDDTVTRCGSDTPVDYTTAINKIDPATCTTNSTNEDANTLPTNRGDGIPDSYIRCTTTAPCSAWQLANVTAVKLYVLARSSEASAGYTDSKTYTLGSSTVAAFNDHYQRHVFSSTVRLINIASRRETP